MQGCHVVFNWMLDAVLTLAHSLKFSVATFFMTYLETGVCLTSDSARNPRVDLLIISSTIILDLKLKTCTCCLTPVGPSEFKTSLSKSFEREGQSLAVLPVECRLVTSSWQEQKEHLLQER